MSRRFNSIRQKFFLTFGAFSLCVLFLATLFFINYIREVRLNRLDREVSRLHAESLQLFRMDLSFFNYESLDTNFFLNKATDIERLRGLKQDKIRYDLNELIDNSSDLIIRQQLKNIDSLIQYYGIYVNVLIDKVKSRGFKDFGLEGDMRNYAHNLEETVAGTPLEAEILQLRRHEKDYFLRKDSSYITAFNERSKIVLATLAEDYPQDVRTTLIRYREAFNELASLENIIGINQNSGRRLMVNQISDLLDSEFSHLAALTAAKTSTIYDLNRFYFIILVISSLIAAIMFSMYISWNLVTPLKNLAASVRDYIRSDFNRKTKIQVSGDTLEIRHLTAAFRNLINKIELQLEEIKDQSAMLEEQNLDLTKINEELDLFVYSAAHDLRSPLRSFRGLIDLFRREVEDDRYDEYFTKMEDTLRRLDMFFGEIVDYGKNKNRSIILEEIQVEKTINSVLQNYEYLDNYNAVDKKIDYDLEFPFKTDQQRLNIILNNLISNALHYWDPGKKEPFIHITFRVTRERAFISIEDNGIGIDDEHLDKIFRMFYRANEGSQGSGLGLFIVMESINKLNGQIRVSSEASTGTKFNIILPNHYHKSNTFMNEALPIQHG